jgi:enamine deaminase RidA (YjgF/YER057c/UK114 family)
LDVFDGTQLLDIKPYIKDLDSQSDANRGLIDKGKGVSSVEIEKKIKSLGLELPEVPEPVASYVPALHSGSYVFTSGQLPFIKGDLKARGKIGRDLTVEERYECARVAALNCLAAVKSAVGELDRVRRVIRVTGFINSAPGFEEQPMVLKGASDLLVEIFGEKGKHSRLAIGTSELPLGTPVEVEMIVEVQ